ncbi:uncharacterized protein LOC129600570 isoform X2 [Paramacrobiotus metropolitanus]|nr:uncharacterized protein LOC129600570 isoform X2 [Paramacrobiotus metropolitanus]
MWITPISAVSMFWHIFFHAARSRRRNNYLGLSTVYHLTITVSCFLRFCDGADYPANFYNSVTPDPYGNEITPYDSSYSRELSTVATIAVPAQSSADRPQCAQATTLTYCLDDPSYPSADIIKDINKNLGGFYKMYAEVTNQSTATLVDGVAADEEEKYDFAFYFGDRDRTRDNKQYGAGANPPFRTEYYKDGGYVCPAFIDYTGLFQAINARGEWQYIVNIKPWMQTVRIEQCFYPQASCSYMSKAIPTSCVQKYSYQRLIAYEPRGRGLYMDVFKLPTACSCYIRPAPRPARPSNPIPSASVNTPQLTGEATQNVGTRAYSGFIPSSGSQSQAPLPPAITPDSSSYAPYYAPKGGYKDQNSYSDSSALSDSVLVEKRRLRPEPLSLGDLQNDPDVDFNYNPNPAPWERRPPPPGPPGGPPPPQPAASRPTGMFALDEYTGAMDADASRNEPSYSPASHPNALPSAWNDRRSGTPNGFVPGLPNPGVLVDAMQPNSLGPFPGPNYGGPPPPGGFMLGPIAGRGPYGPPARTFRPLGAPPLTFYDYNAGHMGGRSGRSDNVTVVPDNSTATSV